MKFSMEQKVKSSEVTDLKVGDRLVIKLINTGTQKGLLMAFVSSDGKTMVNFPSSAYKKLPNPDATAFTDSEFRTYAAAKDVSKGRPANTMLPVKNRSDWVWGDTETCAVAVTITREMITPIKP